MRRIPGRCAMSRIAGLQGRLRLSDDARIKTYPLRFERQCANARKLAAWRGAAGCEGLHFPGVRGIGRGCHWGCSRKGGGC
jgi:hypothetical protein